VHRYALHTASADYEVLLCFVLPAAFPTCVSTMMEWGAPHWFPHFLWYSFLWGLFASDRRHQQPDHLKGKEDGGKGKDDEKDEEQAGTAAATAVTPAAAGSSLGKEDDHHDNGGGVNRGGGSTTAALATAAAAGGGGAGTNNQNNAKQQGEVGVGGGGDVVKSTSFQQWLWRLLSSVHSAWKKIWWASSPSVTTPATAKQHQSWRRWRVGRWVSDMSTASCLRCALLLAFFLGGTSHRCFLFDLGTPYRILIAFALAGAKTQCLLSPLFLLSWAVQVLFLTALGGSRGLTGAGGGGGVGGGGLAGAVLLVAVEYSLVVTSLTTLHACEYIRKDTLPAHSGPVEGTAGKSRAHGEPSRAR
jgi:hypothetical protein